MDDSGSVLSLASTYNGESGSPLAEGISSVQLASQPLFLIRLPPGRVPTRGDQY